MLISMERIPEGASVALRLQPSPAPSSDSSTALAQLLAQVLAGLAPTCSAWQLLRAAVKKLMATERL